MIFEECGGCLLRLLTLVAYQFPQGLQVAFRNSMQHAMAVAAHQRQVFESGDSGLCQRVQWSDMVAFDETGSFRTVEF